MTVEVKGTSVYTVPEFVRRKFGSRYDEWLDSLSPSSRKIIEGALAYDWYPLQEALIEPTEKFCDLFYGGEEKGALEMGRFSAEFALKGIYKIFVKIGSPSFVISRASQIFSTYLRPGGMEVVERSSKRVVLHVVLPESHGLLDLRIAGWMERALEMSGAKEPEIEITRSITKGDTVTEFVARWN